MRTFAGGRFVAIVLMLLGLCLASAYAGSPAPQQNKDGAETSDQSQPQNQQNVPDAPSASRPPQSTFPSPSAGDSLPSTAQPQPKTTPPAQPPPVADTPVEPPPPKPEITPVPPGGAPNVPSSPRDQLYTYTKNVNFVLVPVTVKDESGHMVPGLLKNDFSVYEDGAKQNITFFTSDPFALSAAVIVDTGVPSVAFRKVKDSLTALEGAFSQFDEVSLYSYSNVVQRMLDFTAINKKVDSTLATLKETEEGETGGVPFSGGPLNSGPTINGLPVDRGAIASQPPPRMSHVLNDALLNAAVDLVKRDPTRRKMIFIISDGYESGSTASYREVMKILLSHNIAVYAVEVGGSAIPGYNTAEKIHLPRMGNSNILPKYASASGGAVFPAFTRQTIERSYAELTREARNQYTIGYTTRATPSSTYRTIDVRVDRGGLKVIAKDGYFPLPPGR